MKTEYDETMYPPCVRRGEGCGLENFAGLAAEVPGNRLLASVSVFAGLIASAADPSAPLALVAADANTHQMESCDPSSRLPHDYLLSVRECASLWYYK